jgi:hypothetical protein
MRPPKTKVRTPKDEAHVSVTDRQLRNFLRVLVSLRNDAYRQALIAQVRYRNLLWTTAALLLTVAIVLPLVVGLFEADFMALSSSGASDMPDVGWRQLLTIEVWGAFGGTIGALIAVRRAKPHSTPISIQGAQVAIKLPAGALVAVLALLVLQAGIIAEIEIVRSAQIAGYAAAFGLAEEAATQFVDRKVGSLLSITGGISI